MEYTKVDKNTMKVKDTKTEEHIYPYNDLLSLRAALVEDKKTFNDKIDEKITEDDILIVEADKIGIIAKPIPVEEPIA